MPKADQFIEEKIKLRSRVAIKIQRAWAANKAQLPAGVDDCIAFFTGYKATPVLVQNLQEFIELARKCICYCNLLHDKETMQLLFYSVAKRLYAINEPLSFGDELEIFKLWDSVVGDCAGFYAADAPLQVTDMSYIFNAFLSFLTTGLPRHLREQILITPLTPKRSDKTKGAGLTLDLQTGVDRKKASWADRHNEKIAYFNRGGGLYFFLDILKGLTVGTKDDNSDLRGVYVDPSLIKRPSGRARDFTYAYEYKRARRFGDQPSYQSGAVLPQRLLSVNHNSSYEAFITFNDLHEAHRGTGEKLTILPLYDSYELLGAGYSVTVDSINRLMSYVSEKETDSWFRMRLEIIEGVLGDRFSKEEGRKIRDKIMRAFYAEDQLEIQSAHSQGVGFLNTIYDDITAAEQDEKNAMSFP